MRDDEDALLLFVATGISTPQLPERWRVVGKLDTKSAGPVLLIAGPSSRQQALLAEALDTLGDRQSSWRMSVEWTYKSHGVIVVDEGDIDGPPLLAEFAVDEPPIFRSPATVDWFRGQVLTFDEMPVRSREDVDLCAAIWFGDNGERRLYVNERARCDHHHLIADVGRVLADFERLGPDSGWTRLIGTSSNPTSAWITAIATRSAIERWERGVSS